MLEKSSRKRTLHSRLCAMAMILAFGLRADEGPKEIKTMDFTQMPINQALEFLAGCAGMKIEIEPKFLAAIQNNEINSATLRFKNGSCQDALHAVLEIHGLSMTMTEDGAQKVALSESRKPWPPPITARELAAKFEANNVEAESDVLPLFQAKNETVSAVIMRLIGDTGLSLILHPDVGASKESISFKKENLSALEMLDQLLESHDLQLIRIGDTQIGGVVPIRLFSL